MERKRESRRTLRYKVRWFFYNLKWEDITRFVKRVYEDAAAALAIFILMGLLFIAPHFFC